MTIPIHSKYNTGLKTQHAQRFHSRFVICWFVSGASTVVSGNSKFLAGHGRAMLGTVVQKLWLYSCTCWLQHYSSSTWKKAWSPTAILTPEVTGESWEHHNGLADFSDVKLLFILSLSLSPPQPLMLCFTFLPQQSLSCCKAHTSPTGRWGDKRKLHGSSHQAPGLPAFRFYTACVGLMLKAPMHTYKGTQTDNGRGKPK